MQSVASPQRVCICQYRPKPSKPQSVPSPTCGLEPLPVTPRLVLVMCPPWSESSQVACTFHTALRPVLWPNRAWDVPGHAYGMPRPVGNGVAISSTTLRCLSPAGAAVDATSPSSQGPAPGSRMWPPAGAPCSCLLPQAVSLLPQAFGLLPQLVHLRHRGPKLP